MCCSMMTASAARGSCTSGSFSSSALDKDGRAMCVLAEDFALRLFAVQGVRITRYDRVHGLV